MSYNQNTVGQHILTPGLQTDSISAVAGRTSIKYSVIIPAYNEELGLPAVVAQLRKALSEEFEIIVVDDGSQDGTRAVALELGCRVISHSRNHGKGAAMRSGIKYAQGEGIIFIDADGTYPTTAIPLLARCLDTCDMVVANRHTKKNIHLLNLFGNWLFRTLMRVLYKSKINDPLSGLYGIRKSYLSKMALRSKRFEIETELTIKAAKMRLDITQIEVPYDERIGQTKLNPLRDGVHILRTILAMMFLYNPTYVFILPGLSMFVVATVLLFFITIDNFQINGVYLGFHTSIFASMTALVGLHILVFGIASRMYTVLYKHAKPDWVTELFVKKRVAKPLVAAGAFGIIVAVILGARIFQHWINAGFAPIFDFKSAVAMLFLFTCSVELIFSVFFLSIFYNEIQYNEEERALNVV